MKAFRALFRGLFTSSIYSNYAWSVLNLGIAKGLRFMGILICIRQVGMLSWGQATAAIVAVSFMGFLVDQGLSGSPQVFKVGERGLDRILLRKISLYRLAIALGLIVALQAGSRISPFVNPLIAGYAFVLIPRALGIDWYFHRRERYHLTMLIGSFRTLVFFALAATVVRKGASAGDIILIEIAAETAGLVFSYVLLDRVGGAGPAAGTLRIRELVLFSMPIFITGLLDTIPGSADIFFLKLFGGYEVIGQYDIGGRIGTFYFFFGAALIQIILPKLARLQAEGDEGRTSEILRSSSKILMVITTLLLIPSLYYSAEIVRIVFKKDFPLTIFVFTWIPVWVYVSCVTMQNTSVLLAAGRRRHYLGGSAIACCVNVAGNWILIGAFAGHGVIFARILSESVFMGYSYLRLPPGIRKGYSVEMRVQLANLGIILALYGASRFLGAREAFCAVSVAVFAAIVWYRKTLRPETVSVLLRN